MKTVLGSIVLCASLAHAANTVITVGAGGKLAYSPNDVTAAIGDTLEFVFEAGNHSVAQSTFAAPCQPISNGTLPNCNANKKVSGLVSSLSPLPQAPRRQHPPLAAARILLRETQVTRQATRKNAPRHSLRSW
jgi:hypothetical protein